MPSKTEQVLTAMVATLAALPDVRVLRNAVVPERIPDAGLVILLDGDPGRPEQMLGGFASAYFTHTVEIELFVESGDADVRDQRFDDLVVAVGGVLEANPTLGGLAFGMTLGRSEISTEPVQGAAAIKTGVVRAIVEYEAPASLG